MPQAFMVANKIPAPPNPFLPTVSVIVPIYNGETDLPGLIECLLGQTYPADRVEYLLVDNDSCDRTPEILKNAVIQAQSAEITLRHLSETTIQSAYAARNHGIRAATGEILAFTDADCYPDSAWLENLVQGFTDSAVGLCVGEITALPATPGSNAMLSARRSCLSRTPSTTHFAPMAKQPILPSGPVHLKKSAYFAHI